MKIMGVILGTVAGLIIGGTVAFKNHDLIKKLLSGNKEDHEEADLLQPDVEPSDTVVDNELVKQDFIKKMKVFNSCYNAMNNLSLGKSRDSNVVLSDWNQRMMIQTDCPYLTEFWTNLWGDYKLLTEAERQTKASAFISLILSCGIKKDRKGDVIIISNETSRAYSSFDGSDLVEGENREVVLPAWYNENKTVILEKGIVK